ncbi:response regulator [Desulfomonile tiedjei]|uniref:Response regulator with CheY-like receiver, AAA-type ATPase, and DNA-binding domains n=1 Tax=Desulfomonile tiedjei (strain ATCC 49306 / DSM 6799 / DCB-1) TaxID=706587 RepID=I4C7R0_DESTA|nr:response regulator [Desulfomonile tiedjei]AFM25601.1 response regulator with CheY-like receiver, AAA-type ATPase, and DNA-binding domains [Desulfomonile tiedjei DSM 6799]
MNARGRPKASVLVVDDEQIVHESVRRVLEEGGFRVAGALRVDQALGQLENETFDLTLTDLMMPERSGMEVVEAIAKKYPDTGVVMFTGYATVDSAVESMKLGALDYLPKPFTPEELLKITNRALEKVLKARRDREIEKTYAEAERALRSSLDLKEILNLICSSVVRLFRVKASAVFVLRKRDQAFVLAASNGLSEEYVQKGLVDARRSISEVMESGKPVIVEDADFDTRLQYPAEARRENINSIVSVPMKLEENVFGVLRTYNSEKRAFNVDEMDLLLKFAEQAARALENAMRYEQVRSDIEGLKKFILGPQDQDVF